MTAAPAAPARAISARTAVYAVIGDPVGHSRSPAMHNAAFAALGLDAVYVGLRVRPEGLDDAIRGAFALGLAGLNVTVPHKGGALAGCAALEPAAREIGAVNTLVRTGDGWEGHNTDAPACRALLAEAGVGTGARALLIGAGGAARAAAWALAALGAEVTVVARRPEAARALCAEGPLARVRAGAAPFEALAARSARADVVVNATSVGLPGHAGAERLPLAFRAGQVALDFVYGETAFAREARAAGARLVTGEAILVRQGALAFTLWTGRPAPEAVMTAAVAGAAPGGAR